MNSTVLWPIVLTDVGWHLWTLRQIVQRPEWLVTNPKIIQNIMVSEGGTTDSRTVLSNQPVSEPPLSQIMLTNLLPSFPTVSTSHLFPNTPSPTVAFWASARRWWALCDLLLLTISCYRWSFHRPRIFTILLMLCNLFANFFTSAVHDPELYDWQEWAVASPACTVPLVIIELHFEYINAGAE